MHRENAASKVHKAKSEELVQQLIGWVQNVQSCPNQPNDHVEDQPVEVHAQLISQMPLELWEKLPKEAQQWLRKERSRLYDEDRKKKDANFAAKKPEDKPKLPSQYSKINSLTI